MKNFSGKTKIYLLVFVWVVLCASMYFYFFKIYDKKNLAATQQILKYRYDLALLEAEQQNFRQGQQDLEKLAQQPLQPDNFFSRDTSLVNEIKQMESMAAQNNLSLTISNLSGTVKNATKAKTLSDLLFVTAILTVKGDFGGVVSFVDQLENAGFVTIVNNVNVSSADKSNVSASLETQFYLKK